MFESVSSVAVHRDSRAWFFGTLPVSVVVHGILLAAVPLSAAWKVTFPAQAPTMMSMYSLVETPPPPPPPPPPAAPPKPVVQTVRKEDVRPSLAESLAPTIIPDTIPVLTPPVVDSGVEGGVEGGVDSGVVGGVIGGTPEGVIGGEVGGEAGGVVGSVLPPADEGRVVVPRDSVLRMAALSKTVPIYPERARLQGWEDQNVVRYVIGKDGRVKEVTILDPADRKIFDEATINAIRHWRFRPMIKDGEAKEVVHELTIRYRLTV